MTVTRERLDRSAIQTRAGRVRRLARIMMRSGLLMSVCGSFSSQANAQKVPVHPNGPFATVAVKENLPAPEDRVGFPDHWSTIYQSPNRNADHPISGAMPAWLKQGVTWQFAEARAWPLDQPAFDADALGAKGAETTAAQWMGNAVGVSVAQGMVFAASSDQFIYAINAKTGQLVWRASPVPTTWMGQPLVSGSLVFANAGTVGFNYSNVQQFGKTGSAVRGAGVAYNGVYAFDRDSGALRWRYATVGDVMPTPAIDGQQLVLSDGSGTVTALDVSSGHKRWFAALGGMGNMSSPAIDGGTIFVGMASPAYLFALDSETGRQLWKATLPKASNTGMGDVTPAVADGVVVTDAVSDAKTVGSKTTMNFTIGAFSAQTGKLLWTYLAGRGTKPPSYKGGAPMIHDGVVYVGSPVDNSYQALDLKTGKLLWTWKIPNPSEASSGRGPPAFHDGKLFITTGPSIYALDPQTGRLLAMKTFGGRFGIAGPTIVGGTLYTANTWDWVLATPVSSILASTH